VHQGDSEGVKGLYHINAVDEVTQWEVVGATAQISEAWLIPVLEAMLEQFPFRIRAFHSDNGSEFINKTVAKLLDKLLVEQTKSRPRHSNDNGMAETKNGWVIRKHIGYGHIAASHAEAFDQFYREHFNPSEFSPALRCSGSGDRRERETEAGVSLVCDALGDSAAVTRSGRVPPLRPNHGSVGGHCGGEIGYPSGCRNAGRQEKAVGQFASPTNGMKERGRTVAACLVSQIKRKGDRVADRFAPAFRLILQ
jgi:hypothetical protein